MGLAGLDQALSGVRVAQQQLSVLSNNIANAQVEGFTRKILPQSTLTLNGQGAGVLSDTIIRKVDTNLQLDLFRQTSIEAFLTTKADSLDRIQQFHGPPDGEANFAALLGKVRDSFTALDNDPGDPLLINEAINSAERFAGRVREFGDLMQELRNDAENDIASGVNRVNQILEQIADLNGQISFNIAADNSVAQLEDQRDQAITELSEFLEITSFRRGDGVLVVQTSEGQQLADENPTEVFFRQSNLGPSTFYPDSINGIFVGGNPAQNSGAFDITQTDIGGSIGALVELRDDVLPRFQAQIDELAANVADRFDRQGLRLFTNEAGSLPDFSTNPDNTPDINYTSPAAVPANIFTAIPALGGSGASNIINFNVTQPGIGTTTLQIDLGALQDPPAPGDPRTPDAQGIAFLINEQIQLNDNISAENFQVSTNGTGQLTINSDFAFTIDGTALPATALNQLGLEADTNNTESFALPFFGGDTAVDYIGFAQEFQVNPAVVNDPNLIQRGTITREDGPVQPGSNEVIRRILQFTFGDTEFQQATTRSFTQPNPFTGTAPEALLQDQLGLFASNRIEGTVDLETVGNLFSSPDSPLNDPALGPQNIRIRVTDPTTNAPFDIDVNLSELDNDGVPVAGDTPDINGLVNLINNAIDNATGTPPTPPPPSVSLPTPEGRDIFATQSGGNLVIQSNFDVEFVTAGPNAPANPAPATTLQFLGLDDDGDNISSFEATQPFFEVAVGDNDPTRVTIDDDDLLADLVDKLNLDPGSDTQGVPDLLAEIVRDPVDPLNPNDDQVSIRIRPGQVTTGVDQNGDGFDDVAGFGGEIRIIGGPFQDTTGNPILESVFGSEDPVTNVEHRAFRFQDLGPEVGINSGIDGVETILSYAQNAINNQSSESIVTQSSLEDESTFKQTLLRQFQDESGVNIDEELSNLILVQTAFSASARAVSAIDELFEELLNAIA